VCVCVCERERERERYMGSNNLLETSNDTPMPPTKYYPVQNKECLDNSLKIGSIVAK